MKDSGARYVFVSSVEDSEIFGENVTVLLTPAFMEEAKAQHGTENICKPGLDNLAYLLYTSGTTGNPKGCLLTHRGLYWAMEAFCLLPKPVTNPDTDKRLALACK